MIENELKYILINYPIDNLLEIFVYFNEYHTKMQREALLKL